MKSLWFPSTLGSEAMAVALMVRSLHRASNTGSLTSTCLKIHPWYFCCGCALFVPQWVYSVYHRGSNWLVLDPNSTEYAVGKATVLLCCGEGSPAPSLQTSWSEGLYFGRMQTFAAACLQALDADQFFHFEILAVLPLWLRSFVLSQLQTGITNRHREQDVFCILLLCVRLSTSGTTFCFQPEMLASCTCLNILCRLNRLSLSSFLFPHIVWGLLLA